MPRTPSETRTRWDAFFAAYNDITQLRDGTKAETHNDEQRPEAGLRSVTWKILLLFGTLERDEWIGRLNQERGDYERLREEFLVTRFPGDEDEVVVDPLLADEDENPWVRDAQNEAIRAEILQDVDRCMPDNPYFRQATTQEIMVDVLFLWCKVHPEIGYRQGMHELVAPILWVVDQDAQPFSHDPWGQVLDQQYIRHDTFALFREVMRHAAGWYESGANGSNGTAGESSIVGLSEKIHKELLWQVDPELADCLTRLEVLPQVFLIRWIRLLFGREFEFGEVLEFWDCLFAVAPRLELVPWICVAMLIRVRWQILSSSYSDAFTTLLRYPSPPNPKSFILDALTLSTSPTPEAAAAIIQHHTKRKPSPYTPSATLTASSTSSAGPRKRPSAPRKKPPTSIPVPVPSLTLDSLFSAANTVLDRSPGGLTRAMNKAVDEARRRGLAVAAGPPGLLSPRGAISPFDEASDSERSVGGLGMVRRNRSRSRNGDASEKEVQLAAELEKAMDILKDVLATLPLLDANRPKLDDALGILQALPLPYTPDPVTPTPASRVSSPPPSSHLPDASSRPSSSATTATTPLGTPAPMTQMSAFPMGGLSTSSPTHKKKERASLANSEFSWMLGESDAKGLKFKKKGKGQKEEEMGGAVDLGWLGGS
ncbi:RabGAP/TBC [Ascobolus immersus RN42]|uniref:RabGAP/TBC n=1 Tax=Ascobolus immersus RN42 TaxID=1160509 RepID=A0A3N4HWM9_ASCIM|nr:RabGAP/TBC [Ascobolus immersus RN42]